MVASRTRGGSRPSPLSSNKGHNAPLSSPRLTPRSPSSSRRSPPRQLLTKRTALALASLLCCTYLLGLAALGPLVLTRQQNNGENGNNDGNNDQSPTYVGLGSLVKASRRIRGNWQLHHRNGTIGNKDEMERAAAQAAAAVGISGKGEGDSHRPLLRAPPPPLDLQPSRSVEKDDDEPPFLRAHPPKNNQDSGSSDDAPNVSSPNKNQESDSSDDAPNASSPNKNQDSDSSDDAPNAPSPKDNQDGDSPDDLERHNAETDGDSTGHGDKPPPITPPLSDAHLARGVSGLPMSQTPALVGAKRGTIQCGEDVNYLAYWNDPQGVFDQKFVSPFDTGETKYLSFEPDFGGWNNIRMGLEMMFVLAAATGRTIVLPPDEPMYLIGHGVEGAKSFGEFFDLSKLAERTEVISMADFLEKEGASILGLEKEAQDKLTPIAKLCSHQEGPLQCETLIEVLRSKGVQPKMDCLVFDEDVLKGKNATDTHQQRASRFCGSERKVKYYTQELHAPKYIHWSMEHRLLNHFYTTLYFTNTIVDNHYKRFIRDIVHYRDAIFCAAGKIVNALHEQASGGAFSTLHVRHGELQFKEVKIPAEEWYDNSKEVWKPKELLYIATDLRNKTFFEPFHKHHKVKFLDDYWKIAGLDKVDSGYLGMIDTIVAAQGRTFVGTWHSTFSGYINRIRGYNGFSMNDSWHSYLPRKTRMHGWEYPTGTYYSREWPIGWVGIDGNKVLEEEQTPQ